MKVCTSCKQEKPTSEFYKGHGRCKACHKAGCDQWRAKNPDKMKAARDAWRKKNPKKHREYRLAKYGLTQEQFDAMLAAQGGGCAICGTQDPGGRGEWHIDHDHSCCPGEGSCGACVRGLLCWNCNAALGLLQDDLARMERAMNYIRGELG